MLILELIEARIKKIEQKVSIEKPTNNEIDALEIKILKLEEIIDALHNNINNILNYQTDIILSFIETQEGEKQNIIKNIESIRYIADGIVNHNLLLEFNEKHENFILELLSRLEKNKDKLKHELSNLELKVEKESQKKLQPIANLESIINKLNNKNELITEEEFQTFYQIIEDESIDSKDKIECLKDILSHQNYVMYGPKESDLENDIQEPVTDKEVDTYEDDYTIIPTINPKINPIIILKSLREFGSNQMPDIKDFIDEHEDEIINYGNIENFNKILEFFQTKDIINQFSSKNLISICLYGNIDYIKEIYEEFKKDENILNFAFKIASLWVITDDKRKIRKKLNSHKEDYQTDKKIRKIKRGLDAGISYNELKKNIKFLTEIGFPVSISDEEKNGIFACPHYMLQDRYKKLVDYGMINPNSKLEITQTALTSPTNLIERLDNYIELGLLHPLEGEDSEKNYVKNNSSILGHGDKRTAYLAGIKNQLETAENFYAYVFSRKRHGGYLDPEVSGGFSDKDYQEKTIEQIISENGFISIEEEIPIFKKYAELIDENKEEYIFESYNGEEIKHLDENFGVKNNPFIYVVGDRIVSRKKVLNNSAILVAAGLSLDNDAILYCMTRGSYLTKEQFNTIKENINRVNTLGDDNYAIS